MTGRAAGALVVVFLAAVPAAAVVQASRADGDRVAVHSTLRQSPADLSLVGLLPFQGPPRDDASGDLATDLLRRELTRRGLRVAVLPLPPDAGGTPIPAPLVSPARAAALAREAGAGAVITGRLQGFDVESSSRPAVLAPRAGALAAVPAEVRVRTRVKLTLRVLDADTGAVMYEASARIGPVMGRSPEDVLSHALSAAVSPWFSP